MNEFNYSFCEIFYVYGTHTLALRIANYLLAAQCFNHLLLAFNNLIKARYKQSKCHVTRRWFAVLSMGVWVFLINETALKVLRRCHNGCILDLYYICVRSLKTPSSFYI